MRKLLGARKEASRFLVEFLKNQIKNLIQSKNLLNQSRLLLMSTMPHSRLN